MRASREWGCCSPTRLSCGCPTRRRGPSCSTKTASPRSSTRPTAGTPATHRPVLARVRRTALQFGSPVAAVATVEASWGPVTGAGSRRAGGSACPGSAGRRSRGRPVAGVESWPAAGRERRGHRRGREVASGRGDGDGPPGRRAADVRPARARPAGPAAAAHLRRAAVPGQGLRGRRVGALSKDCGTG